MIRRMRVRGGGVVEGIEWGRAGDGACSCYVLCVYMMLRCCSPLAVVPSPNGWSFKGRNYTVPHVAQSFLVPSSCTSAVSTLA
jgi:hypothetical protein